VTNELERIAAAHQAHFGCPAQVTASAPGRVNLLGEHTDYNGGFVLPVALDGLGVNIAAGRGMPGQIEIRSETFDADAARAVGEPRADHWSDYILGSAAAAARDEIFKHGLRLTVSTTVPFGAGLSSSAALEVATLRAVSGLFGLSMTPVEIALAARKVENEFVGVPCGIMDQFASSVGKPGRALFLNTRTLAHESAPGLAGHAFVVIDSGVRHQLTDGGYTNRVAECQAAREALGVEMLSDLGTDDLSRIDTLPEPLDRRARHIVLDNDMTERGFAALQSGDAQTFGRLMTQSHASERDNYQITVPETDALTESAIAFGALGARQTGGGWGGAVVALVPEGIVERWTLQITNTNSGTRILAVT
jgi:galactokinase